MRFSAEHGAEDPVDERGRVGAAEPLRGLDRLVDRPLGRDRVIAWELVAVEHLRQPDAQDRSLERRDPLQRPAARVVADQLVELGLVAADQAPRAPG